MINIIKRKQKLRCDVTAPYMWIWQTKPFSWIHKNSPYSYILKAICPIWSLTHATPPTLNGPWFYKQGHIHLVHTETIFLISIPHFHHTPTLNQSYLYIQGHTYWNHMTILMPRLCHTRPHPHSKWAIIIHTRPYAQFEATPMPHPYSKLAMYIHTMLSYWGHTLQRPYTHFYSISYPLIKTTEDSGICILQSMHL